MPAILSIAAGSMLGALLRYGFAEAFNHLFPTLPLGTLAANLLGGFLMGICIAAFMAMPQLPITVRLGITTGFLGGLTTFSTFSAESFLFLQRSQYVAAGLHLIAHVLGALTCVALGFFLGRLAFR